MVERTCDSRKINHRKSLDQRNGVHYTWMVKRALYFKHGVRRASKSLYIRLGGEENATDRIPGRRNQHRGISETGGRFNPRPAGDIGNVRRVPTVRCG